MIDLTASDGVLPLACLSLGVPYFGICHNPLHIAALTRRLQSKVFSLLADDSLPFYNEGLANLLSADAGTGGDGASAAGDSKRGRKRPSPTAVVAAAKAAKAKGKGKPRAKMAKVMEEVGDDGHNEDDDGDLSESDADSGGEA